MKTKLRIFVGGVAVAALMIRLAQSPSMHAADQPTWTPPSSTGMLAAAAEPNEESKVPGINAPRNDGQRYLLMHDGRIVLGKVSERANSYVVTRSGGRIVYPKANVAKLADDKLSLYHYRSERIPRGDLAERLKLSRWCLSHHLRAQAEQELRGVLALEPNHAEAQHRLKGFVNRKQGLIKPNPADLGRDVIPDSQLFIARFIEGNGEETFQEFIQLEKLLVNRCGNTGCHGYRHEGDFRLYHRKGRLTDQRLSSRNLQSLLALVDVAEPRKTPLLTQAIVPHGRQKVASFGGVRDPRFIRLQRWVYRVAANAGSRWAQQVLTSAGDNNDGPLNDDGSSDFPMPAGLSWKNGSLSSKGKPIDRRPGFGPPLADDAPNTRYPRRAINPPKSTTPTVWDDLKKSEANNGTRHEWNRPTTPQKSATPPRLPGSDPFDPAAFNKQGASK